MRLSSLGRYALAGLTVLLGASADLPEASPDALQFAADPAVDIDVDNIGAMRTRWRVSIPEQSDAAPLFVTDVATSDGLRDLVIVATNQGRVVALDAFGGNTVWETTPPLGVRWTTSTPAIDPEKRFVFAYCLDGYIHRYAIEDGSEVTGGGWPQLVSTKTEVEKGSSALRIATAANGRTYLYMPTAAYPDPGDAGDYQGHVTSIDINGGDQWVFNAACSDKSFHLLPTLDDNDCGNQQSGIWARAGVVYDKSLERIFVTIGNGVYDAASGGYNWGSSVVALHPDGSTADGVPLDSYTPVDYQRLTDQDLDLSSSAIEILPEGASARYPHLGVLVGKDGVLRLLNLADLSGQGGPRHLGGELATVSGLPWVLTRPVAWRDPGTGETSIFVTSSALQAFRLVESKDGQLQLVQKWQKPVGGTSPVIANGIIYYATSGSLLAVDASSGATLWQDNTVGPVHWQSPIVVGTSLYVCDGDHQVTRYDMSATNTRRRRPIKVP